MFEPQRLRQIFITLELFALGLSTMLLWQMQVKTYGYLIAVLWLYYSYTRIWDKMDDRFHVVWCCKMVFCLWCGSLHYLSVPVFLLTYIAMLIVGAVLFAIVNKIDIRVCVDQTN